MAATRVTVRVSSDRLEARAGVGPGEPAGAGEVSAALAAAGVVHGIDEEAVAELGRRLVSPRFEARDVVVARGAAPVPGRDGELRPSFRDGLAAGTERADGTMDFRARQMLTPVAAGDLLGAYAPASKGTAGRGVDGRELPARDGQERPPSLGEGAEMGPDGVVRALRAGVVRHRAGGVLDVLEHVEHRGDVDLRSGDLESGKSLAVFGSVRKGLLARAAQDVRVTGDVDRGLVVAGGDVAVGGVVVGGGAGHVLAGGSLSARRGEGADLRAGGRLEIGGDAVGCRLAGVEVVVGGRLVGGRASAETLIRAREVGGPEGAQTSLEAGVAVADEPGRARDLVSQARRQRALRAGRALRGGPGHLGGKGRGRSSREGMRLAGSTIARGIEERRRADELAAVASIEADLAHPGLEVSIAGRRLVLDAPVERARMRFSELTKSIVVERRP